MEIGGYRPRPSGRPGALWAGDGSADRWRRSVGQGWRNGDAAGRLGFSDSSVSLLGGSDNIRESNAKGDRELGEWPSGQCECPDGPSSVVCGLACGLLCV